MTLDVGIHDGIPQEDYHADPCPEPSLSRSGIVSILSGTMAEFMAQHPRLTLWPEMARKSTDATDLGEVVHAMVLGAGAKYTVADPGDFLNSGKDKGKPYSTWSGAAKEWKDAQEANGVIVINSKKAALANMLADKLSVALIERFRDEWFDRRCEQTVIFKRRLDSGADIWCRVRPDAILPSVTVDVKTTALSLTNEELGKRIALDGIDVQHAFYQDGLVEAGVHTERKPFVFAFVRTVPPYTVRLVNLDDEEIGWPMRTTRMRIDLACQKFGQGLATGEWPDEPTIAHPLPPIWWVQRCEEEMGLLEIDV